MHTYIHEKKEKSGPVLTSKDPWCIGVHARTCICKMRSRRTHARAVTLKIAEHLLDDVLYSLLFRLGTFYFLGLTPPVQRAFRMMPAAETPPSFFERHTRTPSHTRTHPGPQARKRKSHGGKRLHVETRLRGVH